MAADIRLHPLIKLTHCSTQFVFVWLASLGTGSFENAWMKNVKRGKVDLLSPLGVRVRMENVLITMGENDLNRTGIMTKNEMVYWNLIWYCSRLNVPIPLVQSDNGFGEAFASEEVVLGFNENVVVEKVQHCLRNRGGWLDSALVEGFEAFKLDSDKEKEKEKEGEPQAKSKIEIDFKRDKRLGSLLGKTLSARSIVLAKALVDNEREWENDNGLWHSMDVLFPGASKSEIEGLEGIKNVLMGDATAGKRIHDVLNMVCDMRMQQHFRAGKDFEPLANVYRMLAVICCNFEPEGISVIGRGEERSQFDQLYVKAISRLTLSAYGQLDQNDTELHFDISSGRATSFRDALGML